MNLTSPAPAGPRIKLLALDMDDTLLDRDLRISPGNQRALTAAEERGVRVVLASGRAPAALTPYARQLGLDQRPGDLIAYNGSLIVETDTGRELWGIKLDTALLAEVWDTAAALGQPVQTYVDGAILVSADNPVTRLDTRLTGIPNRVVDRETFLAEPRVKVVLPGDPEALDRVQARFDQVFQGRANMYRSKPFFFEVMPLGADKALALARIAETHGILQTEVMAIGDSWNDEGMLRWAGVSVAMINGPEEMHRLATWVTTRDNAADGVAEAVARYILDV
jgi:Cof subfamily protein (haloacid dehalogenase superfamily)